MLPTNDENTFGTADTRSDGALTELDLLSYDLPPHPTRPRPGVKRVLQADGVNLILFRFLPGQSLPDHQAAHPITVQVLTGAVDFTYGEQVVRLSPGRIVHLPGLAPHRVDCPADGEDTTMLLMMHTGEKHTT